MVFLLKNDHFGVFWGCHHFRKHPCRIVLRWIMFWVPCAWEQFWGSKILTCYSSNLLSKETLEYRWQKTPANHEQKFHEQKKTPERKKIFHDSEALWGRKLGSQDSESPGMGKVYLLARSMVDKNLAHMETLSERTTVNKCSHVLFTSSPVWVSEVKRPNTYIRSPQKSSNKAELHSTPSRSSWKHPLHTWRQ